MNLFRDGCTLWKQNAFLPRKQVQTVGAVTVAAPSQFRATDLCVFRVGASATADSRRATTNDHDTRSEDPILACEDLLEHPETETQTTSVGLDKTVKFNGCVVMWANLLLIAATVAQMPFRCLVDQYFPKLDGTQWHFWGLVTLGRISFALVTDSHVRVDLLHMPLSRRAQRITEVPGILTPLVPFIYLMIDQGDDSIYEGLGVNERSSSRTVRPSPRSAVQGYAARIDRTPFSDDCRLRLVLDRAGF